MKTKKTVIKTVISLSLIIALLFSCVIAADAASYLLGDVNGDGDVDVIDATIVQRYDARFPVPYDEAQLMRGDVDDDGEVTVLDATLIQRYATQVPTPYDIGGRVNEIVDLYTLNAVLMDGTPGVYEVKAVKGDKLDGEDGKTIGIPAIAKQNLEDGPTLDAPAIIMGAANGFETKTGPVEYTMNEGLTEEDITAPYSYFRHKIIDEKVTDADGNVSVHKKSSGFDGSYYIIRVDVSDIIEGKTGYLHVRQESNKAIIPISGMQGGDSTGVSGLNDDGTQKTNRPYIDEATNHWFIDNADTGIEVTNNDTSLSYVDADGNWCVNGSGFGDGLGNNTRSYSIENDGEALKDTTGNYTTKPYVDIIVNSSGKLSAGADAGKENAPSADVKLYMYVDDTMDYDPALAYDPASTDAEHANKVMAKFYKADAFTAENNATSYVVKGSDMEIDVVSDDRESEKEKAEYWSLTKAIAYPGYDSHIIKLICEVPVLEGLAIEGSADNLRSVILDVNSFDIQVANHSETDAAGLTVKNYATLTLTDGSKTSGAELAIGNNASMEVESGGTLIIDESCQLEVEYDAASTTQKEGEQAPADPTPLNNGVITVHTGGRIVNNGIINIEGLEVKPAQPAAQEQGQEQQPAETVDRDMKASNILIEEGAVLDNYGCISLKGNLYLLGTLNNYGRYDDVIDSQDPDKGNISYHRGIQLTWKDDVTVLDEATGTYTVNPDVIPGTLFIGMDADGNKSASAAVNNYGDIVMVPGILNIYAGFNNLAGGEVIYAGRLYVCAVTEAVVPITPDPNDPTKTEERRPLAEPYPSVINKDADAVVNNEGMVAEASVKVSSNGVLGELTVGQEIEI